MGWEVRGNRTYYYRSVRVGDRVVKEYCGDGLSGSRAAEQDAKERQQRHDERMRLRAERERWTELERSLNDLDDLTDTLVAAELLAAGFHRHDRGAWRRRRD